MSPVCPFCGGSFRRGRPACPHCGSDAETGWADPDPAEGLDLPATDLDDEEYADFLTAEGLGPSRPATEFRWGVLLALLAAASFSGLIWWFLF